MRRLVVTALAAVIVLSGCGTERPAQVRAADATYSPAPSPSERPPSAPPSTPPSPQPTTQPTTPTSTQTPTQTATPAPTGVSGPLAAFPLALGLPARNGDDLSPVAVRNVPATKAFDECGRQVWDPHRGTTDVIGVEFRGEAEWFRGRTLVLYPSGDAATAAVATARDVITSCPRDDGDDNGWTEHTGIDYDAGDQSFAWIDRWWTTELDGFDTGLVVYHVVRVGKAVLFTYEYGEGNGSAQTRLAAVARAAKEDQPLVDAMGDCRWPTVDCDPVGDAFTLTPTGGVPFRLGMTMEQARTAAHDVEINDRRVCPELSWTDRSGVRVHGAFSPGTGLGYLSANGGSTTEGARVGDSLVQLQRVYGNLEPFGTGASNTWLSDQGDTTYLFELDGSRDLPSAGGRHVILITVLADDQSCVS